MSTDRLLPRRCARCRTEQVWRDSRWTTTTPARTSGRCQHVWRPIGTASTTRNRKLECHDCGTVLYCSRAQIRRGLPFCACGLRCVPADLEDAWIAVETGQLEAELIDNHPEMLMLTKYEHRAAAAQQGHERRGNVRNAPGLIAEGYVAAEKYEQARQRRLAAIAPAPEPIPF